MATEVGSLYYDLNIDDKNLGKQLDAADSKVKGFGDRVSQTWGKAVDSSKQFALGLAAVGTAAIAFGVSTVKAFEDSQNLIAQTNAVLKSTGQIAGVTADQVTKLASSLERQTRFSDEDVRSVENLLLTFTGISKDIFPQATKTVLDMATALGEDTKSASIQLGKALQDPILGITALRRVGVNFSDAQKTVIENLVNTGQKAKAQQLILKELNTEFGGSAVAAGNTFAGALDKLKNQFNNVQEAIGQLIVNAATPFLIKLNEWFDRIGGVDGVMEKLRQAFERIKPYWPVIAGAILSILFPAVVSLVGATLTLVGGWLLLAAPGVALVLIAQKLGIGMKDVHEWMSKLKPVADQVRMAFQMVWDVLRGVDLTVEGTEPKYAKLQNVILIVKDALTELFNISKALWEFQVGFLVAAFNVLVGVLQFLWPSIHALVDAWLNDWLPALEHVWESIMRVWNALNPALIDALKIIGLIIGGLLLGLLWLFINALNVGVQAIAGVINFLAMLIGWFANLVAWIGNAIAWLAKLVGAFWSLPGVFQAVAGAIVGPFRGAFNAIASLWNGTVGKLSWTVPKWVPQIGGNTIGVPKIPTLAEGGIVDRPTLALIGEAGREAVIPLNKLDKMGGDTNINGDINIFDKSDADYLLRRLDRNQQLEAFGGSPA